MKTALTIFGASAAAALVAAGVTLTMNGPPSREPSPAAVSAPAGESAPLRFVTRHSVTIRGQRIDYTATAGETFLVNASGAPIASIFSFSYVKTNPADLSRPVLFVFNGGPGSSSVWLHMGVVGPRRVALDREVNPRNVPPFGVVDNPYSVLDVADIVFIDPVGTGFSRAVGEGRPEEFWGVDEDANAVAQFIELWITENRRWNAPKFLMGESYGSQRAAVLPRALMGGPFYAGVMRGITVNGIVLLGTTMGQVVAPDSATEARLMRAALELPGYAATAWHHNRINRMGRTPAMLQEETTAFAKTVYYDALMKAAAGQLGADERRDVVEQLVAYTGLSASAFEQDLSIARVKFGETLLADQGLAVGQYDSRYTLPLANSGGDPVADDPAMGRYVPGFIAAFHQMLSDDLKVALSRPYAAIMWKDLLPKWNWKRAGVQEGQSFAVDLVWAMRRNPDLHVLVASGYYDLVTTVAAAEHAFAQVNAPAGRITFKSYESGHMLYLGDTAEAFADDVRALIERSKTPSSPE